MKRCSAAQSNYYRASWGVDVDELQVNILNLFAVSMDEMARSESRDCPL